MRADKDVPYGVVVQVMAEVRKAGVDKLGNDHGTEGSRMMMSRGRAGNGLVFNRMVLASLFLHVLFLSCFFLSPSLPEKKWTFGPVYSVELVSGPVNLEDGKKTAAMSREMWCGLIRATNQWNSRNAMRAVLLPSQSDRLGARGKKRYARKGD